MDHPLDLAREAASLTQQPARRKSPKRDSLRLAAKDLDHRERRIESVHERFRDQEGSSEEEQDARIANSMHCAGPQKRLHQVGYRDLRERLLVDPCEERIDVPLQCRAIQFTT